MFNKAIKGKRAKHTYDIEAGDFVEVTIVGKFDGHSVTTFKESYFHMPAGTQQLDPDVTVTKYEQKKGRHGIYE